MSHATNQSLTAEDLFSEMKRMPAVERTRFFSLLTGNAFRDDDFSHEPPCVATFNPGNWCRVTLLAATRCSPPRRCGPSNAPEAEGPVRVAVIA
jgi:hypothetical protein